MCRSRVNSAGLASGGGSASSGPRVGVGVDVLRSDNGCGFGKESRLRRVAANGRNGGEVVERLGQTGGCGGAGSLGCDR